MNAHGASRIAVRLALVASLLWPTASPAFASPYSDPVEILREGFEVGSTPTYVSTPINSEPYNGSAYGYWGPVAFRALNGQRGLWCNGSRAAGVEYLSGSAGWADFELTQTADYYDSDATFGLYLPSRGSGDKTSFGVKVERKDITTTNVYEQFQLTPPGQWRTVTQNLGGDTYAPLSKMAGKLRFRWTDRSLDPSEWPVVGEGPTIDDVVVTGWKYGPVRNLSAVVGTSAVSLAWARPFGALNSSQAETRTIGYRVWRAVAGTTNWDELTAGRLADGALSQSSPIASEGVQYNYSVQAWDPGTGSGYSRSTITTVSIPINPPTVGLSAPAAGFPLTLLPVSISGTAADIGSGLDKVQVRIRRADGYSWNGFIWVASDTWINASTSNAWANWSYSWTPDDTLIASGQIVSVSARARDMSGFYSSLAQVSSGSPVIGSVSLASGAPLTTTQSVGAAVSASGATHMRYRVNGAGYTAWTPFSASPTVDLGFGDGTKTVTFEFSQDGTNAFARASDSIFMHTSIPSVSIAAPGTGYSLMAGPVAISGTASDTGSSVTSVQLRVRRADGLSWDGAAWSPADTWLPVTTNDGYASWSATWTPDAEIQALGQIVSIAARATDEYGLTRTSAGVSSSVPVAASLSLAGGAAFTSSLDVEASIAATGGPTTMRYQVDSGPWSAPEAFAPETSVALPAGDGTRTVTFEVGNGVDSATASDTIYVHTSVPSIAVSSPVSGFIQVGTVAISGTASDVGSSVEGVDVRIRRPNGKCWNGLAWVDSEVWLPASATSAGYATWGYLWPVDPVTVATGEIVTVSARARDTYGLQAESVGIASTAPIASSVSISGGDGYTKLTNVPVNVSALGATYMRYRIDSGPFTGWLPYSSETSVTLATNGSHTVSYEFSANQIDPFGPASDSIIVDRDAPTVVSALAPQFTLAPKVVSGTASDPVSGVSRVRLRIERSSSYWNGVNWQPTEFWLSAAGTTAWSYSWTPSPAQLAGYDPVVITVQGDDAAGNTVSTSVISEDPKEPTSLPARALATTINYGATASIVGTLTRETGAPLANKPVRLEYYAAGWQLSKIATTSPSGVVTMTAQPSKKTTYRLVFSGDTDYQETQVPTSISITPRVYLTTPVAPSRVARSVAFTAYGYLRPRHSSGSYPVRIYRYRYVSGRWKSYGYVKAKASNYSSTTSKYSVRMSLPYTGKWRLRAVAPADTYHATTYSSYRYVTTR